MTNEIDLVVVGGSAGALPALAALLPALPARCAVPVVIVVHLPAARPSRLAAALGTYCSLPVREVEDKDPVAPGGVYVGPPGYHILVERTRTFALSADATLHYSRPAIDVLFESAADAYGGRLAGIVLTGANEDGARGLRAIESAGGLCLVQAPGSAMAPSMPEAAIAATRAPHVVRISEIAAWLSTLAEAPARESS